jgi:hypothetical protein
MATSSIWLESRPNENFSPEIGALRWAVLNVSPIARLRLRLVESSRDVDQAVMLTLRTGKGQLSTGELCGTSIVLWASESSNELDVDVESSDGLLVVEHAWREPARGGNPSMVWHDKPYSAMLVEQAGRVSTYRCNNGRRTDEFDKLAFSIEIVASEQ